MGVVIDASQLYVYEYFYSLQGEGVYSGRAAFFIRLAGCNVGCKWCDSRDSWLRESGKSMSISEIIDVVIESGTKIVVITGGEPMLHNLDAICKELHKIGVRIHLETSGSEIFSGSFDWITLSPKKNKACREEYFMKASELKVVIECVEDFLLAESYASKVDENCTLLMQSEWNAREGIMPKIIDYIKKYTKWGLSLQTHKFIGVE